MKIKEESLKSSVEWLYVDTEEKCNERRIMVGI